MPSRRQYLAAVAAAGGIGTAAYVAAPESGIGDAFDGDVCPDRRSPRWQLHGEGWSPAVVDGGRVYVSERWGYTGTDDPSRIAAVDTYHGHAAWADTVVGGGAGVPLVTEDAVFVGTGIDTVLALERETGHRRWTWDAGGVEEYGGGAWGQPTRADDRIVVGVSHSTDPDADPTDPADYRHRLVALDAADGTLGWEFPVDDQVKHGPITRDGVVVAGTDAGRLYGVDAVTGDRRFSTTLDGELAAPPQLVDGHVAVLSSGGTLLTLDPATGEERWRSRPVADGVGLSIGIGVLVAGGREGRVVAVDATSGDLRWTWTAESDLTSVATGTDERVGVTYALDARGIVHVLAPEGRRRRFRVAERVADRCGWNPQFDRATAVTLDRESLYVTGPFVARFETRDP